MATYPFPSYHIGYILSIYIEDIIAHLLTQLCVTWVSIHNNLISVADMPRLLIFLEPKRDPKWMKTNPIFMQYIKMMTENIYHCILEAITQWHASYLTNVYPWIRILESVILVSIADNKWRVILFHKKGKQNASISHRVEHETDCDRYFWSSIV